MAARPGLSSFISPSGTPPTAGQWDQALDAWMSSPIQISLTGRCFASEHKCEVDLTDGGRFNTRDVRNLLNAVSQPPVFNVTCASSTPCRRTGDMCKWTTHPPQAANCQAPDLRTSYDLKPRPIVRPGGGTQYNGDMIFTSGNVFGTNININRKSHTYQYNGNTYHSDMGCIFDEMDETDMQDFHDSMQDFHDNMQNFHNNMHKFNKNMNRFFGPGGRPRGPQ